MNRETRLQQIDDGTAELAAAEGHVAELEGRTPDALANAAADRLEGKITIDEEAEQRDAVLAVLDAAREAADGLRRALPELRQRLAREDEARRLRQLAKARDDARRA